MPFAFLATEALKRREARGVTGIPGAWLLAPNHKISEGRARGITALWIGVFVMVWWMLQSGIFPTPVEVVRAIPGLWEDGLEDQIWASLSLNVQAVSLTVLISLAVAYATVLPAMRPLAALVSSGRFNGFVGLPLIFTAIFGSPHAVKVALLVFGMSVFTVLSLVKMIDAIPKDLFDDSRTLRMGEWRVVWEVVILGRFDEVIDIMRVNVAMGWMMLPMVEGRFKFEGGVGALIENESKHMNLDAVFAILLIILGIGAAQDALIGLFKKTVCGYASLGMERNS